MLEERGSMRWLERGLFLCGLLVLVHPVISSRFFFTVDGPAHAYNASLLLDLFRTSAAERPWELNPVPVPNWTGHILLALLQLVVDAPEALKVVHLMCLAGLPLAFRAVVKSTMPGTPWASTLALPMAAHLPFHMGYLNFSLGMIAFLLVVHRWERLVRTDCPVREWWWLALLLTLSYFSHLVPFLFALIWLGLQWVCGRLSWTASVPAGQRSSAAQAGRLLLCALPGLIGTAIYLYATRSSGEAYGDDPAPDRLHFLSLVFQAANGPSEAELWYGSLFVIGAILLGQLVGGPGIPAPTGRSRASSIATCLSFLVAALLLAVLPDRIGKGGDLLIRIALFVYLCGALLVARIRMPVSAGLPIALIACGLLLAQHGVRNDIIQQGDRRTRMCYQACSTIAPGSTVATAAFHWTDSHLTELALADRGALHLSNYEFINPHFQLRWKGDPNERLWGKDHHPLDVLLPFANMRGALIEAADHIVLVGSAPSTLAGMNAFNLEDHLERTHKLTVRNEVCRIYQRK